MDTLRELGRPFENARFKVAIGQPQANTEWNAVYEATARLVGSGAVKGVLESFLQRRIRGGAV